MVISKALKYFTFFVFFGLLIQAKINHTDCFKKYDRLVIATESFITAFFAKAEFLSLTINMAKSKASNFDTSDFGNKLLNGMDLNFRIIVRGHQRKFREFDKRRSPIILILNSIDSFNAIKVKLKGIYPKYYLIILVNGIFHEIDEVIKDLWGMSMIDVNFLAANDTHASIYTYFPFGSKQCGTDLSLKIINTFDLKTETWANGVFYGKKAMDGNRCALKIGVTENRPMVMIEKESSSGTTFTGFEVLLLKEICKLYNFVPIFKLYSSIGNASSGLLGSLNNRTNDIAIGTLSLQIERTKYLSVTSMYASIPIIAVISPSQPISPFEKLYLPFDFTTWILLLTIFIIGYAVILFTKFISIFIYQMIVGQNVNFPFTNMLIGLFGGTQATLPRSNFSRFLLGKFLIFCLVMRGLYQGKMFDIMKKDLFEKMPYTFEDLLARNCIFYTYETLSRRVQGLKIERK